MFWIIIVITCEECVFPVFSSGNTTFYEEFKNEYGEISNDSSEPTNGSTTAQFSETTTGALEVDLSEDRFTYEYSFFGQKSNDTDQGMWTSTFDADFEVIIDITRNVVTKFYLKLLTEENLGDASKRTFVEMQIDEGGSAGIPGFLYTIVLFALIVNIIFVIIRKKRK